MSFLGGRKPGLIGILGPPNFDRTLLRSTQTSDFSLLRPFRSRFVSLKDEKIDDTQNYRVGNRVDETFIVFTWYLEQQPTVGGVFSDHPCRRGDVGVTRHDGRPTNVAGTSFPSS